MTKQFTPLDRGVVRDRLENCEWCYDTFKCGHGIKIIEAEEYQAYPEWGSFTRESGWYHDSTFAVSPDEDSVKVHIMMPITEVPEE